MNFKPLADNVLIRRVNQESKSSGGILIPDSAQEKPQQGEVIAIGSGKLLDNGQVGKMSVKKGDRILFGKYSGSEIELDGQEHLIVREQDILGVFEK